MGGESEAGEGVFLREASGLIKSATTLDTFIFNTGLVSVGIGIATMLLYTQYIYPGSSLVWASIIAGVTMYFVAWAMLCWTNTLPRSGGIYVFGTRSLPPSIAYALSFVEGFCWLYATAVASYWIMTLGVSPAISTFGILYENQSLMNWAAWVANDWPAFIGALIVLTLSGLLLASGMRNYFFSQKIVITIGTLGSLLMIIILLFTSQQTFIENFNHYMGSYFPGAENPYQHIIDVAYANGYQYKSTFDFWQTVMLGNWAFMTFIGAAFSIAIGGEIRSGAWGQNVGIVGAITFCIIFYCLQGGLALEVMGYEFMGAVSYNYYEGIEAGALPVEPWITVLITVLTGNPVVALLVLVSIVCWVWMWIPGMHVFGQRIFFAWSIDRLAPDWVGYVSDRTHTPINSIALSVFCTYVLLAAYIFGGFSTVMFITAALVAWSIVMIAGIFFPYTQPGMYEKGPIAGTTILGLPQMTVACALGTIAAIWQTYVLCLDGFASGLRTFDLYFFGSWFVLGFVFYWVMYFYRQAQGINVELAFQEIPVE